MVVKLKQLCWAEPFPWQRECYDEALWTFCGGYVLASDPLVTDKERVQMMAGEVWKVIGY